MSVNARRILNAIRDADHVLNDPGAGGLIDPFGDLQICELTTSAAESRTLANPTKAGIRLTLRMKTDGGDCTITVGNGFNVDGDTQAVFANVGDQLELISVSAETGFRWEVLVNTGPAALSGSVAAASAFDDVWGWWRADSIGGSSPTMTFTDLSGNSRTMTQQAGTLTAGTAANGQAHVAGNSTARLDVSGSTLAAWPLTVINVAKRTAAATCGLFGASGTNPFNNHWFGWEGSNSLNSYNTNSAANTDSTGGATGCYVSRVGYGSRVQLVNGLIQATMSLASIVKPSAVAPSIGTQYRGLNCEWQETLVWDRLLTLDEIDEVHAYLNTRYGLSVPMWSSYTPSPTVIMQGQSNSAGRGDRGVSNANIPAEYLGSITGANVWHGLAASNGPLGSAFETLSNTASKTGFTGNHMFADNSIQPTSYIGAESALCKEYLDANGGSVWLNKYAVGSTSLAYQVGGHWSPTDNTQVHSATARHFGQSMYNWWLAMRVHQLASRKPDVRGIVWHQGEQDASIEAMANAYQANLESFVDCIRAEIGFSAANAKMFICRLHDECPETYTSTVRAAQVAAAAAKANCQLVDLDSYEPRSGDPVHLSYNGQHALGQYLATQL